MKSKIVALLVLILVLFLDSRSQAQVAKTPMDIITTAKPSIVRILYEIKPGDEELLQFYWGGRKITDPIRALSGSGFVVNGGGYILTNFHVVYPLGKEPKIYVRIPGEGDFPASVVRTDRERNLILLAIQKFDLKPVVLGDSVLGTTIKEGQDLLAMGYPFAGKTSETTDKEPSATKGIISAFKQTAQEATFIQTDASVNEGNSGGPAFNNEGSVIGVVFAGAGANNNIKATYKFIFGAKEERPPTNISFVVPIDHAKHMLLAAKVDWMKPEPARPTQTKQEGQGRIFSSPKILIPVGTLIVLGALALFYLDSAKRKKEPAVSDRMLRQGTTPNTATQPLTGAPSPRTTTVSAPSSLKCTGGELAGRVFPLSDKGINIGRGPGNEIQLSNDVVSRRQTWIGPVAGEIVIKDLGSTNGTFVNDQQVTGDRRLRSGDTIRITKNGQDVFTFTV
jgi:S1-C subfamily serine protease